jgi:hypothetical protein
LTTAVLTAVVPLANSTSAASGILLIWATAQDFFALGKVAAGNFGLEREGSLGPNQCELRMGRIWVDKSLTGPIAVGLSLGKH